MSFFLIREETVLTEAPTREIIVKPRATSSKPVPLATLRSSKLAAMAANMKSNESKVDIDLDYLSNDEEEDPKEDQTVEDLDEILIVPEVLNTVEPTNNSPAAVSSLSPGVSSLSSEGRNSASPENFNSGNINEAPGSTGSFGNMDFMAQNLGTSKSPEVYLNQNSSPKNLSLTSVNGTTESEYRLDPK